MAFFLALLLLITTFAFPINTSASVDLSGKNITTVQKYFLRTIGSLARADYYQTDVLASVTLAQGIYESGWGRYSLPVGGNNLFGIKAFSTWTGKVYDQSTSLLYESYDDFLLSAGVSHVNTVSAWRAHDTWAESVLVHSNLFREESKYAAVIGEKDYKKCAQAIVNAGYCSDAGYVDMVCNLIEQYGLAEYDNLTPDEDGIVALTIAPERKLLDIGETYQIELAFYPEDKTPTTLTWASDNPSVATVDENGLVTAVSHGMTLITATLANGREAALIVYVDCNATVIDTDMTVYSSPSRSSTSKGMIYQGSAIKVTESTVYTDTNGEQFYKITGYKSNGTLIDGYARTKNIYLNKRNVSQITTVKDSLTLKVNDQFAVKTVVAPCDAVDTTLTWACNNENVATVDQFGVITAKALGVARITAKAAGGAQLTINLTVANDYREYNALAGAYEALTVRTSPSSDASRAGTVPFLSDIKVIGEPIGTWYKVSGVNSSGTTVNGYASSSYVYVLEDGCTATIAEAPDNVTVYKDASTTSTSYGRLLAGTKYAVVEELDDGWKYIIGVKTNNNSVRGYAKITPTTNNGTENSGDKIYTARTTSDLNVRSAAGTTNTIVGRFALGTQISVYGEETDGWCEVSGISNEGVEIRGYCSADYLVYLYSGTVNATQLNVRDAAVSGTVVGQFNNGDEIIIVGTADNGWYSVESTDGTLKGYCSADYVINNGKIFTSNGSTDTPVDPPIEPDPPVEPDPTVEYFEIIDPNLSITNGMLKGAKLGITVSELLKGFKGTVEVVSASGEKLGDTAIVGTGCKLRVTENDVTYYAADVLIVGDVDGDAAVSSSDYLFVKRYFMDTYELTGVYLSAAMVGDNDILDVTDYVLIKRACFGTYLI